MDGETEHNTNNKVLDKVGNVVVSISQAKNVDQVICALHSLAVHLFPLDSCAFLGSIDKQYRDEVIGAEVPSVHERNNWWHVFYRSTAFPTMARVLLLDVALNWLSCFPISSKKHLYDVFFLSGSVSEVVQTLVPYLQHHSNGRLDTSICLNIERLLALCLLENDGVLQLVKEFSHQSEDMDFEQHKSAISRVAQLVTSVPDKARLGASTLLSSHLFVKRITTQLIQGAEDWEKKFYDESAKSNSDLDGSILFIGDSFSRICRRGSADVLLSEVIPKIISQVRSLLQHESDLTVSEAFKSKPGLQFWSKIMEAIKDSYATERISEQLMQKLAAQNINDAEGYWILWLLFHKIFELQASIRSMFTERFLLWKVFPVCCLRWILQFSVLQYPPAPDMTVKVKSQHHCNLLDTVGRLLAVWSKRDFVQSAPVEQQAYLTAAVGLSLEKHKKEDLDASKDAMHLILQGVSCRLESPSHLVRKMANSVALVFSKVIDPSNPLYLDDSCKEETIDWDFTSTKTKETDINQDTSHTALVSEKEYKDTRNNSKHKELMELTLVDPDEVIDPATLNNEDISDEVNNDDDDDEISETSSESSLQPYDLSDDDTDLKKNFSQLVDVVGALRKSDDADGVERALDVAEKLIQAAPDELSFIASDLVRTLVQVRCSDSTLEGEEDSAEEKRQKALIALIVNCPLVSLDSINKLLYSPNVDTSQRIMILDVMTDAALELAQAKTIRQKHVSKTQILTTAETQPWFLPSSVGPAGATMWKEISTESPLSLTSSYERELPNKPGLVKRGKSKRWSVKSMNVVENNQVEWSQNKFPPFAAAFMLPAMKGFDKKSHGVDFLGRDFIVLGKLIHMLGNCMKCSAMHPEASALALPLLDMLSSREISHHAEAYVRKSVLFAASCILLALNPTYVASALVEGSSEISRGLEWVRTWALSVAESDTDKECYMMAMACLQLHSEMALQTSRALESSDSVVQTRGIILPSNMSKGKIKISI